MTEEIKPSVDQLFEDFLHPNPNINKKASHEMVAYWPNESMEKLIFNLNQDDIEIRRRSINALGLFGDCVIAPIMKIFLASKDLIVRTSCLKVLIKVASLENYDYLPKSLEKIIECSLPDENPQIVLSLVLLLRQLDKHGLPALIQMSRDQNVLKAKASIMAIGEINEPNSRNYLLELLKDSFIDELAKESIIYALENFKMLEKSKS